MKRTARGSALGGVVVALAAALVLAACGGGGKSAGGSETKAATKASAGKPIVIGAAVDLTNSMSFVDGNALYAAQVEIRRINQRGGVLGHKLQMRVINDQLDPRRTRAAAQTLISKGVDIGWVTCDVDWATPAIQQFIKQKMLTVSPCIGTDQMGPKRFGDLGKYAFSTGNAAQDEGAAMAEYAFKKKHWRTAITVTDNVIVYFQNVCQAFTKRWTELGGKVVKAESFTQGDKTVHNVVNRVTNAKADVIAICSFANDFTTFVAGVRSLRDETPMIGPWSTGTPAWVPKGTSNFYYVTYASIFGNDPSPRVRTLVKQLKAIGHPPLIGGFVAGAAAIDAIADAIKKSGGSTNGDKLASIFESFRGAPTIAGPISFSPKLHSVFGRPYRVMVVEHGKHHFVQLFRASSPANI